MVLLPSVGYAETTEIVWYKLDFPPYTIKDGPHQSKGLGDKIQQFVSSKMTGYSHESTFVTASRMYADVSSGKQVCSVNSSFDTFSEDRRGISLPTNIYYNYHVVTIEDMLPPKSNVSLVNLLETRSNRFLLDAGRPYQHLDTLLEPYLSQNAIQLRSGESLSGAILDMIDRNRAEYTLELCSTVRYLSTMHKYKNRFQCMEIAEHPKPVGSAAITCSRSEWGERVVSQINEILLEHRGTDEYKQMMSPWYLPEDKNKHNDYWQHYEKEILQVTSTALKAN